MKTKKVLSLILCILLMFSFCSFSVYGADVKNGDWKITTRFYYYRDASNDYISRNNSISCNSDNLNSIGEFDITSSIKNSWTTGKLKLGTTFVSNSNSALFSKNNDIRIELTNNEIVAVVSGGFAKTLSTSNFTFDTVIYDINDKAYTIDNAIVSVTQAKNNLYSLVVDIPYQKFDVYKISVSTYFNTSSFSGFGDSAGDTVGFLYGIADGTLLVTTDKGDKTTGLLDSIIDWIKQIIEDIKSLPEKISNSLSRFFENLGNKLTELKDGISNFFENLWNNLKSAFEDIGDWFSELGESIGQFFTDLGESIKGFFEMLKNYLLYFQHPVKLNSDGVLVNDKGQPIYTNPFDSAIDQVKETVDGWISDIKDFINDMDTSRVNVSGYLKTGTGFINDIMSAAPILSACVIFAAAFFVIRKVVGR